MPALTNVNEMAALTNGSLDGYPPANAPLMPLASLMAPPAQESGERTIIVPRRRGVKLGLTLDGRQCDHALIVMRVDAGLLKEWNEANQSQSLQQNDSIVAINGIRGDPSRLVEETRNENNPVLKLTFRRGASNGQSERTVRLLAMEGKTLGLSVDSDDNRTLLIASVRPGGLVDAWNASHPASPVKAGDRITSVNGQRGAALDILEHAQRGGEVVLGIVSP